MTTAAPLPTPSLCALHAQSVRLSGVMKALAHLENDGGCMEGRSALIFLGEELAEELCSNLDLVENSTGR